MNKPSIRPRAGRDSASEDPRQARLKAALKANLARRKGQARARAEAPDVDAPQPSKGHENDRHRIAGAPDE